MAEVSEQNTRKMKATHSVNDLPRGELAVLASPVEPVCVVVWIALQRDA